MKNLVSIVEKLNTVKRVSPKGGEYWMARDLQPILGYEKWDNFENVISKAIMACESIEGNPTDHFLKTGKKVDIGSGAQVERADYFLTRYACYLIAMNGDSGKPEVGVAQTYFAVQTRRQELSDQLTDAERRLQLRERVKNANKSLASTAKNAGVQQYGLFQNAGYVGLYEMGLSEIKRKKGLGDKEDLLDRAGRTELAANEFRITQTEEKLKRDGINTEKHAIDTHRSVGQEVRNTIKRIGGKMPEDLPVEESIKKLKARGKGKTTPRITD